MNARVWFDEALEAEAEALGAKTVAERQRHGRNAMDALLVAASLGSPAALLKIGIYQIPHYLGWLNYWSAATAQALGFPDPSRDADLISRSRRTASGGWVVQLTDALLDLDLPVHLDALLRAYERFPGIGGRATP